MELRVGIMHYEWGKYGSNSEVAKLHKNFDEDITIDEEIPYAELWMGTHVNCPSYIKSTDMLLSCVLQNNPAYLGDASVKKFGQDLPFLFKVLSVKKALSIQVHPNKDHAIQLHKSRPDIYKDPNHKPELAIALTDFSALCGFRPYEEIQSNLKAMHELQDIIGKDHYAAFLDVQNQPTADTQLQQCFKNLMTSPEELIKQALHCLLERFQENTDISKENADVYHWISKLNEQFPNDVGCFAPIFMNVIKMAPGQAIFLGANEIHAYLEGDCIECMAASDNVIRAGLTPKFKDVETLCNMLNYRGAPAIAKLFQPSEENSFTKIFRPPVPDFAVAVTHIPVGKHTTLVKREVASIAIFVKGCAYTHDDIVCMPGTILFIPANAEVCIVDVKEDITCYIGMANV